MSYLSLSTRRYSVKQIRHYLVAYLLDWGAFALSGLLAFELRFDGALPVRYMHPMEVFVCIWVVAKSAAFIAAKLNRGNWRYTSAYDAVRIILANSAGSILGGMVIFLLPAPWVIPRSVLILDWLVSCLLTLGGRLAARVVITARKMHRATGDQTRTLIYGAGTAGLALLWELRQNHSLKCDVVGLIDDDPSKAHLILQGKPVLGSGEDLRNVVRTHAIKRVLIAIPSATEEQMVRILKFAIDAEVEYKMVPGLGDIIQSTELGEQIRSGNVTIEHMLSRRKTDKITEAGKRVLLLGGAGYIGSGLLPKLLNNGYKVRLLDAFLYGEDPIAQWKKHPNLEIVEADFRRVDIVVRAMRDVKAVVHLGAIVGDPACALDEELTIETNLLATRMIAEVTKGEGIEKFIFASSCSVYGASDTYLDENSPLNPVSLYARSKIACENVLLGMKNETFRPVILRFGTIYGLSGRTRFDLVVNLLTAKAMVDGALAVFGSDQWRPFLHVDDAALAVYCALQAPDEALNDTIFNVGSDEQNYTLGDVGRLIKRMVPSAELEIYDNGDIDRRNYRVNFSRIRKCMGYAPKWKLKDGIEQVIEAIRDGKIKDYQNPIYSNVRFLSEEIGPESLRFAAQCWAHDALNACNSMVSAT